jgi:site-specific recombinase XerD
LGRVPVSAAVVRALDTFIKDWRPSKGDGPLFLNNHGDELSEDGWSSVFRRIKSRLPRKHRLQAPRRSQHRTHELAPGRVDIRTLGYLAGHSRIEHTARYLGAITPAQIDAVPDVFARAYSRRAATP